ncbi:MAG: T9SS type A sorting domain-containing protein [Saprospiraceae bacterium]
MANTAGGIYYQAFAGQDQFFTDIVNTEFKDNTSALAFVFGGEEGAVRTNVTNCSFLNNGAYPFIKNYSPNFNYLDFYNTMDITNCIIQEYAPIHHLFYNNDPDNISINDYHIRHSLVNVPNCSVNGVDACGEGVLFHLDPMFFDTLTNLRLVNCSPAINAGENLAIDTLGVLADIQGNERVLENIVDMGAYEVHSFQAWASELIPESCEFGMDGSITIETNSFQPFTIFWENETGTGISLDSLTSGNYLITVIDEAGCIDSFSVEIGSIANMDLTYTVIEASGFNIPDGLIAIGAIAGGTPPYSLVWENGDTLFFRQNLLAGNYTVTVTDINGCTFSQNFTVSAPDGTTNHASVMPSLTISPNPNNGQFVARFETAKGGRYGLTVFDLLGKALFHSDNWLRGGTVNEIPLDMGFLPDGHYWVELRWDGEKVVRRFVKME